MRKTLDLARIKKCSQMKNIQAGKDVGPDTGTGSGGDRCTEAVAAMIDATYQIGPLAKELVSPQKLMYAFTEDLNNGSDESVPEDGAWIAAWAASTSQGAITISNKVWPGFGDCQAAIDRGHLAIVGVGDYLSLQLFDDSNPYQWPELPGHPKQGHVMLLVGYDDNFLGKWGPTVIVMDPLRALSGMPYDYSFASLQRAIFHDLSEVLGPDLSLPPPPPVDAEGVYVIKAGDTLSAIGQALGLNWHNLYQQNLGTLQAAAQQNGHPEGCHNGDLIFPGTVLRYQR